MTNRIDPEKENIKNTFAPNMTNEYVSIDGIIHCLRYGFMQMNKLPADVRKHTQAEINRRVGIFDKIMSRGVHSELVNPPFNGRFKRM